MIRSIRARLKQLERAMQEPPAGYPLDAYHRQAAYHDACAAWREKYSRWAMHGAGREPGPLPQHPCDPERFGTREIRSSEIALACVQARLRGELASDEYFGPMEDSARREADAWMRDLAAAAAMLAAAGAHPLIGK